MIEEYYYYTCHFCNAVKESANDFRDHVNAVHFPDNCDRPQNVSAGAAAAAAAREQKAVAEDEPQEKGNLLLGHPKRSQSYDLRIYSYNASVVVG
jgi:hypothetical protein